MPPKKLTKRPYPLKRIAAAKYEKAVPPTTRSVEKLLNSGSTLTRTVSFIGKQSLWMSHDYRHLNLEIQFPYNLYTGIIILQIR